MTYPHNFLYNAGPKRQYMSMELKQNRKPEAHLYSDLSLGTRDEKNTTGITSLDILIDTVLDESLIMAYICLQLSCADHNLAEKITALLESKILYDLDVEAGPQPLSKWLQFLHILNLPTPNFNSNSCRNISPAAFFRV